LVVTTEATLAETKERLSFFATRYRLPRSSVSAQFAALPLEIVPESQYRSQLAEAYRYLGRRDPSDVPLAALALKLEIPIWSNDRDFEELPLIAYPTAVAIDRVKNALLGRDPALRDSAKLKARGCERGASYLWELKPRDAANFAETVFELAAAEPETDAAYDAWRALGVMRPSGFGERVLKLALSRRPHWKTVSRDMLNKVLIAIQPDLNERFWDGFEVQSKPAMLPEKRLVEKGVSRFMFSGTGNWTGD